MEWAREGRQTAAAGGPTQKALDGAAQGQIEAGPEEDSSSYVVAPPPGEGEVQYASLAGD